jgi:hypothetical protein
MKQKKRKSWVLAYCGMVAALSVALMLVGAIFPIAMFIAPALASFLIATVCVECGRKSALTTYAAVSLLGLLFVPDKEVAMVYAALLGYYPLLKPYLDHIRMSLVRAVCKLLLCNGAMLVVYGLVLLLFPAGDIAQELKTTALVLTVATLLIGDVAFLLYDRALVNLLRIYDRIWRPRLHRMIGRG